MENKIPQESSKSIADKLLAVRAEEKKQDAIRAEEVKEYKKALNQVFATKNGQHVLKKIVRYCGINSFDNSLNPATMVEDNGKKKVFLELIRPYLSKDILIKLIEEE